MIFEEGQIGARFHLLLACLIHLELSNALDVLIYVDARHQKWYSHALQAKRAPFPVVIFCVQLCLCLQQCVDGFRP